MNRNISDLQDILEGFSHGPRMTQHRGSPVVTKTVSILTVVMVIHDDWMIGGFTLW